MKRILILIHFIKISFGFIVIPFHFYNDRSNNNFYLNDISGKDFLELTTNKLVSTVSVGTPFKELDLYITMDYKLFFIGKGYCEKNTFSNYIPESSTSFSNNSFYSYPFDDLRNMTIGKDKCTVFNSYNLDRNTSLYDLQLLYGSMVNISNNIIYEDKICGIMGFKLHRMQESYYSKFKTLQDSLRANNISNYTTWSIEFFDEEQKRKHGNFDGFLILGVDNTYLEDIKKIKADDVLKTHTSYISSALEWMIPFNKIYYNYTENNRTEMNKFLKSEINFDLEYYFITKEYFESIKSTFFKKYIDEGICKIQKLKEFYLRYQFIVCNKNSFNGEISKFPSLIFLNNNFEDNFELTYKDCFKEINGEILFLLFYDPWSPDLFKFGKNFLKKYQLMFNYDSITIGFLNFNRKSEDDEQNKDKEIRKEEQKSFEAKQLIWIFILLVLLIGIVIGVFAGKKIWDKARKKRANELLDDYDYETDNKKPAIN
jgi:hypothetical protein